MKILFLTTEDHSFWSHRLALARAAKQEGADVVIMARAGEYRSRLEGEGFRFIPWNISRRSLNPFRELRSFVQVVRAYRREEPDLVHHIAFKPIVYGGLAGRFCGATPAVNTVTGLGPIFTNSSFLFVVLRRALTILLKYVFKAANCKVIVQNQEDRDQFVKHGITDFEKTAVIHGFGVDTKQFVPLPESSGVALVMLPCRMLWEKGVREFVAAAEELRNRGIAVRMVLVGAPDPHNPGCIPDEQLRAWAASGAVEWWGYRDDMSSLLSQAHVVCLPSYREGLPKVLLEAAACGRAIVTTSAPGCSSVVRHGDNGLLVPIQDPQALAGAIHCVLMSKELRATMGAAGRARAISEFSDERVAGQTLSVYRDLLNEDAKPVAVPVEKKTAELTRV